VAAKLVHAVRDGCRIPASHNTRPVTTSIGVTVFDRADTDGAELLRRADLAMYDAKHSGRDRYSVFRPSDRVLRGAGTRLELVERIERALQLGHFTLDAQPIIDLRTGLVRDHELLLRLQDPAGAVAPAAFLGVAEQAGLLGRIDRWVLGAAIDLLRDETGGSGLRVTVNVSPGALTSDDTLQLLADRFADNPSLAGRLVLEVPERGLVGHLADAGAAGARLHRLGVRLSLDDFRAGLGAFSELQHLPFDLVKIDGHFVRGCIDSPADRLVIRALVDVAHGLGKEVVAEYVEDADTVRLLLDEDVDYAQGFHLGRPFPSGALVGR
jgi:EAL domain-containing protein (putative c-di-GMP-specific phosphodiesterase class I)